MIRRSIAAGTSVALVALAVTSLAHAAEKAPQPRQVMTLVEVAFVISEASVVGSQRWPRVRVPVLTDGRRLPVSRAGYARLSERL
jgi:hypothetical protein